MKKLLTFLTLLTLFFGVGWAGSITFGDLGLDDATAYTDPFDGGDFTVTFGGGGNNGKYYDNGSAIRVYAGGTMTIAAKSGNISQITITYDGNNKPTSDNVVNVGTYNSSTGVWTGSASSVVFTRPSGSGHWRVQAISVTIGGSTPTTYSITGTGTQTGGSVTASATSNIAEGTSITITATPSTGYDLSNLTVDGNDVTSSVNSSYEYTFNMPAHNVAVSATFTEQSTPPANTIYERVTKLSTSDIGKEFVFVCESQDAAMGAINGYGTSISVSNLTNGTLTITDEAVVPFTLGGSADAWTFENNGSYISWSTGNSLTTSPIVSTNSQWAIIFSGYNALITNGNDNTRNLRYNASSPRFACYTSSQTYIQLYRKVEGTVTSSDVYMVGQINGHDSDPWVSTEGVKLTYNSTNDNYAADIYCTGLKNGNDDGYSYFLFAKSLPFSWDVTSNLYGSGADGSYWPISGLTGESAFDEEIPLYDGSKNVYRLPAGLYTVTVDLDYTGHQYTTKSVKVTKRDVTLNVTNSATFTDTKNVTMTSNLTELGGKIWYTTDGSDPRTQSNANRHEYTEQLTIDATTTFKAVAVLGCIYSDVVEKTYTKTPAAPVITPASCTFNEPLTVNITAESGATIYYTTDDSNPTSSNGTQYTGSFTVSATTTVKARAYVGEVYSSIAEATYTYSNVQPSTGDFQLVTSTSDLVAGREYIILTSNGSYAMGALTGSNPKGSQVTDFTLNGTTVTAGSTVNILTLGGSEGAWTLKQSDESYITLGTNTNISSSSSTCALTINISNNVATIQGPNSGPSASTPRQILHQAGSSNCFGNYASSNVGESNYTTVYLYYRGSTNITPVFTPAPGLFNIDVDVTISTSTDGATIYYTTDGSDPKTSSTRQEYTSEIIVSETTTFKAYAVKDGDESEVVEATYTINKSTTPETVTPTYRESFTTGDGIGKFLVSNESGFSPVWTLDGNYGVKGTAYSPNTSPTNNIATSWLLSPYIDLTGCVTPEMTFAHQINSYFNDVTTQATLWVREITNGTPGEWAQLTVNFSTPASESWTNDVATYDLTNYIDKTIQFGFKYMTTENSGAGTWEIQNFVVSDEVVLVNNIAEFKALENGTKAKFKNPVTVLYDYAQYSNNSYHEYIWFKDESGYCQFYLLPTLNSTTDTYSTTAKYENGDIIPAGFTVTRNYYTYGDYMQAYSDDALNAGFQNTDQKGLADPDHYTFTTLNALQVNETDIAQHCNRYIYIPKIKITSKSGKDFDFTDESGATNKIVGFNKFSDASSLQKDGSSAVVTVPDAGNTYYNVKAILQLWKGSGSATKWEILPIEFEPWAEKTVTLRELCKDGVTTEGENEYTISNNLLGVYASADGTKLWVKDASGQSIWMASPVAGDLNFEVYAEAADGVPANTRLEQAYYDQSNWCEIHLTGANAAAFKGQIINGGSIHGKYTDDLNPTLENVALTTDDIYSEGSYAPNYYMPANFFGRQACQNSSHSTDFEQYYFYMTPKPQEYAQIVWAVWNDPTKKFIMSTSDNDNGHRFEGEFAINLEMNDGVSQTSEITDGYGYNFKAIVRKTASKADGFMVYPLDLDEGINPATSINTVDVTGKAVKSVKYVNVAGIVSDRPFQGVNIVVTEYTDGSRTTTKMLRK